MCVCVCVSHFTNQYCRSPAPLAAGSSLQLCHCRASLSALPCTPQHKTHTLCGIVCQVETRGGEERVRAGESEEKGERGEGRVRGGDKEGKGEWEMKGGEMREGE